MPFASNWYPSKRPSLVSFQRPPTGGRGPRLTGKRMPAAGTGQSDRHVTSAYREAISSNGPFPLCLRNYDRSRGLMKGLPPFPRLPRACQHHMSGVHCPVMLAPVYPVADFPRLFVRCAGNQYLVSSGLVVCHQRITSPSCYHTACPAFLGDLIGSHLGLPLNTAFRLEKSESLHHSTMCNNQSIIACLTTDART